jgi:hypothetical protein
VRDIFEIGGFVKYKTSLGLVRIYIGKMTLFVKQFQGSNIEIYGTFENPLFKASDISDLLGI